MRAVAALVLIGATVLVATPVGKDRGHRRGAPSRSSAIPTPGSPARRIVLLGRSVRGRAIRAVVIRGRRPGPSVLVVSGIHGDEAGGIAVVRRLVAGPRPASGNLHVVFALNPDGVALHTRQNARGVDLNRNFPYRWQASGRPGDQQFPGSRPLSEPEARIAARLIRRLRPSVTVWLHQPLAVTDLSGGDPGPERRFSRLSGLPLRTLTRYAGSGVGWENHVVPHGAAFVVELPRRLDNARVVRYSRAILRLLDAAAATRPGR